jgi:hypothetical protein
MVFPPEFEDIDLEDVTMEDDFQLAKVDKDPFSDLKVQRFKNAYTSKKAKPITEKKEVARETVEVENLVSSEIIDRVKPSTLDHLE